MANYLLIIDGNSLLTTCYYGILPNSIKNKKLSLEEEKKHYNEILQSGDGTYTNAIYGFLNTLLSILKNQKPSHIIVNWDEGRDTFRKQLFNDYKANRGVTPEPLKLQKELCKKILTFIGIKQFSSNEYEADDFSGSLAKHFENDTYVRILTKDRDHLQLVNDKTNIWIVYPVDKSGKSKQVETLNSKFGIQSENLNVPNNVFRVTPELVKPFYGVTAEHIIDYKALMGDTADNIKGVKNIGEKSAIILLDNFDNIENLYSFLESNTEEDVISKFKEIGIRSGKKIRDALLENNNDSEALGKASAFLSKKLATIKTDINFGDLSLDLFTSNINHNNMIASLRRLELNHLLDKYYCL